MNGQTKIHTEHNPIREYDAHIYYSLDQRASAESIRNQLIKRFSPTLVQVGRLWDRPVGPHPLPMFEVNFLKIHLQELITWLQAHRGDHTVLVHEVTGNDPRDHSEGALWLGPPVALDISKLDPAPT